MLVIFFFKYEGIVYHVFVSTVRKVNQFYYWKICMSEVAISPETSDASAPPGLVV